jgi:hypothetical protein
MGLKVARWADSEGAISLTGSLAAQHPQLLAEAALIVLIEIKSGQRWERHQHGGYRPKTWRVSGVNSPNVRRAYDEPWSAEHLSAR